MMGAEPLSGAWTHSFEEDEGDVQVYRSSNSFAFPPARRARETLEFRTPGQVVTGVPGPDDRLQRTNCSLIPIGMGRFRIGEARVIEVIQSTGDILKVRPA
jgi:F420-dependent methylenetetrahydromethanopterin dehydrogenase